jgi:hypothetical protein
MTQAELCTEPFAMTHVLFAGLATIDIVYRVDEPRAG